MTKPFTLKRAAALREMASLGCTATEACILLELDIGSITYVADKFSIEMRKGHRGGKPWLQGRLMRDAKHNIPSAVLAERYGTSAVSIRVTICRMRKAGLLPPSKSAKVHPEQEATP